MDILNDLIDEELKSANEKFPLFQTMHEAYGVMREELEETNDEFKDIKQAILIEYWNLCKNSKKENTKYLSGKLLDSLDNAILHNLRELIQLGAMVRKSKLLNKGDQCDK